MALVDLIFMTDCGADPIWTADENSMVSLEQLPISSRLKSRIRTWASRWEDFAWESMRYDDVVNGQIDGPAEPVPNGAFEEIDREGRQLCEDLRAELAGRCRVAYATFPDGRHLQWEAGGPVRPG
jgi:hypothetical protein